MFFRKHIFESFDERLVLRGAPAQPVAADLMGVQIHLGAHQPVNPQRVHFPMMAQHADRSCVIRPPQVNDRAAGALLQIQFPMFWKHLACRGLVVAPGAAAQRPA